MSWAAVKGVSVGGRVVVLDDDELDDDDVLDVSESSESASRLSTVAPRALLRSWTTAPIALSFTAIVASMTGSISTVSLLAAACFAALVMAWRVAEERAAGVVDALRDVLGSKWMVMCVLWRGSACIGPRTRAAVVPVVRDAIIVVSGRVKGSAGVSWTGFPLR